MAEHFGHEVMVASSVESAIQRFSETPFDVVLTGPGGQKIQVIKVARTASTCCATCWTRRLRFRSS